MQKSRIWSPAVIFLLCISSLYSATEFLYPVDVIQTQDGPRLCVIHQISDHLDLWFWDPVTQEATKGLLSSYIPAGLCSRPDQNAFCFIDNDRLYIKSVFKKGPQAIDFVGPYELSRIYWINNQSFYFSAKERTHYNLFYAAIDGSLCRLTHSKKYHYLYPQLYTTKLFFIRTDHTHTHTICSADCPLQIIQQQMTCWEKPCSFSEKLSLVQQEEDANRMQCTLIEDDSPQELYRHETSSRALSFLSMISLTEGFFAEHPAYINKKDARVTFCYYHLVQQEGQWLTRLLFEFSIPTSLLFNHWGSVRLYESMYPLLPKMYNNRIYFSSVDDKDDTLALFYYDRAIGTVTCVSGKALHQSYFSPVLYNDKVVCGGALARQVYDGQIGHHDQNENIPYIQIQENSSHFIYLPSF